ncbi:uncharacterized protein LY79DRAFT_341163 [Colletotrichum navitas]|uniref:Secreted protein n=1 Tax=Colletotrichum navitas TaxID=681940 RepID=A0AAD8PT37_9PEZI|nr:uncharacterized protein LY79DRAFT_341163 [Colletotrichum navitas]KAK1579538.1 hypothetical protein LY79DRAFT_341163 [Colletotrichum navitas]
MPFTSLSFSLFFLKALPGPYNKCQLPLPISEQLLSLSSLPFPAHPLGGHPSPFSCSSRPCPSSAFASTAESQTLPSGMGRLEPDDWPAVMQPAAFFSSSHWCHMYDLCPSLAARQHLLAPLGILRTS